MLPVKMLFVGIILDQEGIKVKESLPDPSTR